MLDEKRTAMRVALNQLLDYCQIFETIVTTKGKDRFAAYGSSLLAKCSNEQFGTETNADFISRMYDVRNDAMHGKISDILTTNTHRFSPLDVDRFTRMVHALAGLYILNGNLQRAAKKLVRGENVALESLYPSTPENMKQLRQSLLQIPTW